MDNNDKYLVSEIKFPDIRIYTNPESGELYPAMHVGWTDEDPNDPDPDCRISLLENKYYGEESLEANLQPGDLRKIDRLLREQSPEDPSLTKWEYMCKDWNENSKNAQVKFPHIQPDYTTITEVIQKEE